MPSFVSQQNGPVARSQTRSPALQGLSLGAVSGTSRACTARTHEIQHTGTSLKVSYGAGVSQGGRRMPARCMGSCTKSWEMEDTVAAAAQNDGAYSSVTRRGSLCQRNVAKLTCCVLHSFNLPASGLPS